MAALTATRQGDWANFGNMRAGVFEVTCSGSYGHIVTGLQSVWFACSVSETASSTYASDVVFNSNNGTADSLMGAVYLPDENASDILQVLVIGRS